MFSGAYMSVNQSNVIVESEEAYADWLTRTAKQPLHPGLDPGRAFFERRLARGDKGWATVPPAPAPMVNDPGDVSNAVVDAHGKCHELENLYIADASVFPSCPSVGPGLTVIAMALRLEDHLS